MSTRKKCFVKLSGDTLSDEVLEWIKYLSLSYFVVVCVGGGTQINEAFKEAGFEVNYGPLGRETKTFEESQLARDILERNQVIVQDRLAKIGAHSVSVVLPVLDISTVLCHINGDLLLLAAYIGFDELYAITIEERVKEKKKQFKKYPKIKVVGENSLPYAA